MVTSLSQ